MKNYRLFDNVNTSVQSEGPLYPWYDSSTYNVSTLPKGAQLGEVFWRKGDQKSGGGNAFMWVKANAGLTVGQLIAYSAPGTDTASTGSTTSVLNLTTGGLTVNAEIDNWVWVDGTTKEWRRIVANTASTITVAQTNLYITSQPADPNTFTTAPSNTNPVSIWRPWNVRVCTQALIPIGVALGTVTSGYYTVVQVAGHGLISATGSGTALAVGVPAVPAAAGVAIGSGGTANAYTGAGVIMPLYALAGANQLIPANWDLIGNI